MKNPNKAIAVDALKTAFSYWSAYHKAPNSKCIAVGPETLISPKELNDCIQKDTGYGPTIIDWLATPEVISSKVTPTKAINTLMYSKGGLHR